jgi:hypothetical protein
MAQNNEFGQYEYFNAPHEHDEHDIRHQQHYVHLNEHAGGHTQYISPKHSLGCN